MGTSSVIGLLSVFVVCAACLHVTLAGGPSWLDGNEAAFAVKVATAVGLMLLAERMWRASGLPEHDKS